MVNLERKGLSLMRQKVEGFGVKFGIIKVVITKMLNG